MSIENNITLIINNNWEKVKSEIRHTWRKLTEDDVNGINNYDDLVGKLSEVYELSEEEVGNKIDTFIEKLGLEPNLTYIQGIKESFCENTAAIKDRVMDHLRFDSLKKNAGDLQSEVGHYIKKNPLKSIGFGVLAAVIIKKLFTSKSP